MTIQDAINACFELFAGLASLANIFAILRDKAVKGFSPLSCGFFTAWGYWNLYYYPHLDQWLSFWGGVSVVTANTVWLFLIIRYRRRSG